VIKWTRHVAIQESDKSSRLTGRTLCVSKKLLYTICNVGHPHEMVFVEPSHVFLNEMVGNQDDRLAFELRSLPRVSKIAIGLGTHLSLASEVVIGRLAYRAKKNKCSVVCKIKLNYKINLVGFFSIVPRSTYKTCIRREYVFIPNPLDLVYTYKFLQKYLLDPKDILLDVALACLHRNPVCNIVSNLIHNLIKSSLMGKIQDQSISTYLLDSLSVLTLATGI
jgi:hypothetical protein